MLNVGANFARGIKDTPVIVKSDALCPYQIEMKHARSMYVVLYDTQDSRGWLVDGASALLHLTRTQLSCSPYKDEPRFKLSDFHHANPKTGADAGLKALMDDRNREIVLLETTKKWSEVTTQPDGIMRADHKTEVRPWQYQDLVRQTWDILTQIRDHQSELLVDPKIELRGTDRPKLEGFGFRDIVEGSNPLKPRVAILQPTGKGWVPFIRSVGAVALLGKGFGELIEPAEDANYLCNMWRNVPKNKDFLAVCTSTLEAICTQTGTHDAHRLEITQGIFWHRGPKLYEPCSGCKPDVCDRVQNLHPRSLGRKTHPRPFGVRMGGVVFGRMPRYQLRLSFENAVMDNTKAVSEDYVHESSDSDSVMSEHTSSQSTKTSNLTSISNHPLDTSKRKRVQDEQCLATISDPKENGKTTCLLDPGKLSGQVKALCRRPRLLEYDEFN